MFVTGRPTTDAGLWFCDILWNDGRVFCSVLNMRSEHEAWKRAEAIADALNAAPKESFE